MALRYKVVLCRGISEKSDTQEAYVKEFEAAGYTCNCLNTLRFEFVNFSELRECLLTPEKYLGLILTSRRAVEAIGLASKENRDILNPWRQLAAYCVGPATESFAKSHIGSQNCLYSDAGSAKELAEKIITSVCNESKPLLYPCSEIARETVEQTLSDNEIKVQKIVAYRTLACESLELDLFNLLDSLPKIFVFFSPSTVEHVVTLLKKKSCNMENVKAVAIGPVTRQALVEAGLRIYATASKPEPVALLRAITNAEKDEIIK